MSSGGCIRRKKKEGSTGAVAKEGTGVFAGREEAMRGFPVESTAQGGP